MQKKLALFMAVLMSISLAYLSVHAKPNGQSQINPEEARTIAKQAYLYGNPLVDSYRIIYDWFIDKENPAFKTGWNQIANEARVYTPDDTTVQTANSDTPYSYVGLDLRAEPMVLTVPQIEGNRNGVSPMLWQSKPDLVNISPTSSAPNPLIAIVAGPSKESSINSV